MNHLFSISKSLLIGLLGRGGSEVFLVTKRNSPSLIGPLSIQIWSMCFLPLMSFSKPKDINGKKHIDHIWIDNGPIRDGEFLFVTKKTSEPPLPRSPMSRLFDILKR